MIPTPLLKDIIFKCKRRTVVILLVKTNCVWKHARKKILMTKFKIGTGYTWGADNLMLHRITQGTPVASPFISFGWIDKSFLTNTEWNECCSWLWVQETVWMYSHRGYLKGTFSWIVSLKLSELKSLCCWTSPRKITLIWGFGKLSWLQQSKQGPLTTQWNACDRSYAPQERWHIHLYLLLIRERQTSLLLIN